MAFKVLKSNEIELLTETQRNRYEKELAIYQERNKLVEQMEKFENTEITPYKPILKNISAISKVPENEFVSQEYVLTKINSVTKPEQKVVSIHFNEPVTTIVPKCAKVKSVPFQPVKKMEQCKPVLPEVTTVVIPTSLFERTELNSPVLQVIKKTSIPSQTFKKTEDVKPDIPMVAKPQSFTELNFVPVDIDHIAIMDSNSKMTIPTMEIPVITALEENVPVLPKTEVECLHTVVFDAPEQTDPTLPKVAVICPEVKEINELEQATPVLPRIAVVGPEVVMINELEQTNPTLPKANLPDQVNVTFKLVDAPMAQVPVTSNISTVNAAFTQPDIKKPTLPVTKKVEIPSKKIAKSAHTISSLPIVTAPKAEVSAYIVPNLKKSMIPTFTKPESVSRLELKPVADCSPKIEYPSISIISVRPIQNVSSKVHGLPSMNAVEIPDAYISEEIKKLLSPNKENEIKEGALA